jgi:hypothetical protein
MTRFTEEEYQAILSRTRRAAARTIRDEMATPLLRTRRHHPEDDIQRALCELWETKYPATWKMTFHVPNGLPAASAKIAARFRGMGFKPGVLDLLCIARRGHFNGFALELKSASGTMSPAQNQWQEYFAREGWFVALGFTFNAALAAVDQYHQLPERMSP